MPNTAPVRRLNVMAVIGIFLINRQKNLLQGCYEIWNTFGTHTVFIRHDGGLIMTSGALLFVAIFFQQ